jgi:UDPglucose--hexose-1-phosphate uridylyltransferase
MTAGTSPPEEPHRRYDPLRDGWVLVSAGRDARPWLGQVEPAPALDSAPYDPSCYLCPGNLRVTGSRNPRYTGTLVFDNDFPALRPGVPAVSAEQGLHRTEAVAGTARVICFTPRHDLSLGSMPETEVRAVVDLWADQTAELGRTYRWVQIFENRGEAMGASNPHPHGQIWAGTSLPTEAAREDRAQLAHLERSGRALLDDVRDQERGGPLVVDSMGEWLAIVPFWATWPFELLVIGPAPARRLDDLDGAQRAALSGLLGRLVRRFDGLFDRPFPYSMGWHQAPFGTEPAAHEADGEAGASAGAGTGVAHWRLHAHVFPPLLRADARKFMVGYELLSEPQRDLTPEEAAERLRGAGHDPGAT